ncbi:MAG: hypothetical protein ACK56F_24300 [bacterium]
MEKILKLKRAWFRSTQSAALHRKRSLEGPDQAGQAHLTLEPEERRS